MGSRFGALVIFMFFIDYVDISSCMPLRKLKITKASIMGLEGKGRLETFVYHEHDEKVTLLKVPPRRRPKKVNGLIPEPEYPRHKSNPPRINLQDPTGSEASKLYQKYYNNHPEPPHLSGLEAYRLYEKHYIAHPEPPHSTGQEVSLSSQQNYYKNPQLSKSAGHEAYLSNQQQHSKYPQFSQSAGHEAHLSNQHQHSKYPDIQRPEQSFSSEHEAYFVNQLQTGKYPDTPRPGQLKKLHGQYPQYYPPHYGGPVK